jgi:hypothetical protein
MFVDSCRHSERKRLFVRCYVKIPDLGVGEVLAVVSGLGIWWVDR